MLAVKSMLVPVNVPPPLMALPCKVSEVVDPVPTPALAPMMILPVLAVKVILVPPIAPVPLVDKLPDVVVTCNVLATVVLAALIARA